MEEPQNKKELLETKITLEGKKIKVEQTGKTTTFHDFEVAFENAKKARAGLDAKTMMTIKQFVDAVNEVNAANRAIDMFNEMCDLVKQKSKKFPVLEISQFTKDVLDGIEKTKTQ